MLWGYFYFPQLQLDVLLQLQACQLPLVIVDSKNNQVVQLNKLAQEQGIKKQMGLATAASLFHQLQVIPYERAVEEQELTHIVESLYDLVSDIAIDGVQGVFVRFGNMLKLYQGIDKLTHQLNSRLADMGLHYHYAAAYSAVGAKVLAKALLDKCYTDKTQLKIMLNNLTVAQVFESPKVQDQLGRLGIKTLAQLEQLEYSALTKRFDSSFLTYYLQLVGKQPLPLCFYQPKPQFNQEMTLLYEISTIAVLLKPVGNLLKKLSHFLVIRGLASLVIILRCQYRGGDNIEWRINSAELCDSADKWYQLIALYLEKVKLSEPVVSLGLHCHQLSLKSVASLDLFDASISGLTELELISLLQAKLGGDRVYRPQCSADHRPELANTISSPLAEKREDEQSLTELIPRIRPSYLLAQPEPLLEDIKISYGPERIETAWWQKTVIRDYFIAQNQQQQWCWVFRDHQQRWFLHGYFG